MSMLLMVKIMRLNVGHSTRKFVLLKLADNANDNGECFPSYQHIADHCEISRRSAINHINALCAQGLVKKVYRKGEKGNSSNIFILNLDSEKRELSSERHTPDGENKSSRSEQSALPPSEKSAPRTSHFFEAVKEPIIESKKITTKATLITNNFKPNDHHVHLALTLNISIDSEFVKFKDYCLANGKKYVDWNAGFNNWLRNAGIFQNKTQVNNKQFMTRTQRNMAILNNMRSE